MLKYLELGTTWNANLSNGQCIYVVYIHIYAHSNFGTWNSKIGTQI